MATHQDRPAVLGSPIRFTFANKDDSVIETSRIPRPTPRRLSLPSSHLRPHSMSQPGPNGARVATTAKGMNSFARGDAPAPNHPPPNGPPPPPPTQIPQLHGSRGPNRADTPYVPSQPLSPRAQLAESMKFPMPGPGNGLAPGHGRANSAQQPQTTHLPPSYPPPAPPVASQMPSAQTSPKRRPRAGSDATSQLTEPFAASSDADMSVMRPPPSINGGASLRKEDLFRDDTWKVPQQHQRQTRPQDFRSVMMENGLFPTNNNPTQAILTGHQTARERLGDQRDQYHSEPNMTYAIGRRNKAPVRDSGLNLNRSYSNRERTFTLEGEPRANSPTLPVHDARRALEYRHSAEVTTMESRGAKRFTDYDRDIPDDASDASGRTQRPGNLTSRHHKQPLESPQRPTTKSYLKTIRHISKDPPASRKRARDYDDQTLATMEYATLRQEDFEVDPSRADKTSRTVAQEALSLPEKLDQHRHASEEEQRQFFRDMSMRDWETSGDWFMDQFSGLMGALRQCRRDRRQVIADFEDEISKREEAVRLRTDGIEKRLKKMKKDGERVMQQSLAM